MNDVHLIVIHQPDVGIKGRIHFPRGELPVVSSVLIKRLASSVSFRPNRRPAEIRTADQSPGRTLMKFHVSTRLITDV